MSSTLNWKDRGLSLTQTTDLPLTSKVTFTVTAAPTDAVNIQFRKPDWLSSCQVGDHRQRPAGHAGGLQRLSGVSRVWKANDKVESRSRSWCRCRDCRTTKTRWRSPTGRSS